MRSIKKSRPHDHRLRILRNIILILVIAFAIYLLKDAPQLSEKMALRSAETQNLIGPGKILAKIATPTDAYPYIYLLDEGEAVGMFTTKERGTVSSAQRRLYYREKTGRVTLVAEPIDGIAYSDTDIICIFAFDEFPGASRAELELHINYELDGIINGRQVDEVYNETFTAHADREYDGLFIFQIEKTRLDKYAATGYYTVEDYAFSELAQTNQVFMSTDSVFPATVRFYNSGGKLLSECDTFIESRASAKQRD